MFYPRMGSTRPASNALPQPERAQPKSPLPSRRLGRVRNVGCDPDAALWFVTATSGGSFVLGGIELHQRASGDNDSFRLVASKTIAYLAFVAVLARYAANFVRASCKNVCTAASPERAQEAFALRHLP